MITTSRNPRLVGGARLLIGAAIALGGIGDAAAQADSPTAVSAVAPLMPGTTGRQLWRISDFTTVQLVVREKGAVANDHPWHVEPSVLHQELAEVKVLRAGADKPLFGNDELDQLVPALVEAFGNARPDQDIAIVSSGRHEDNTFLALSAVTARMFRAEGRVNFIVHDARYDFYDAARGMGVSPSFTVGSRTAPGSMPVHSAGGTNLRSDWLAFSGKPQPVEAVVQPVPAAPPAFTAPPVVLVPTPSPAPAPAAIAPPVVRQAAPAAPAAPILPSDPEQRLTTLKRLFDKGLITEAEYQKKRQEVLQGL